MSEIPDYAVSSFLNDQKDFAVVLKAIECDRTVFAQFYGMTNTYKNAHMPFSLLLKPIGKMCVKERDKLDEQIKVITQICSIYNAVAKIIQKESISDEEKHVTKTILELLVSKFNEYEDRMRHWHPFLNDKILYMHQACNNVKKLINELY